METKTCQFVLQGQKQGQLCGRPLDTENTHSVAAGLCKPHIRLEAAGGVKALDSQTGSIAR